MANPAFPTPEVGRTLVRIHFPRCWDESLLYLLEEGGFGPGFTQTCFAPGTLAARAEEAKSPVEVQLVIPSGERERLGLALQKWFQDWGVAPQDWSLQEQAKKSEGPQDLDFEALWKARWRPFRCAGFVIHADFHNPQELPLRAQDQVLKIFTGAAFGTGGHASTRMALKVLAGWCREGAPTRLLDVGTGSGILAVAAALKGVFRVEGMDPDPNSALQAIRTAQANGVGTRCQFWRGKLESARGAWPAVMANLEADLLQREADSLIRLLRPGGRLFTGGILALDWPASYLVFARKGLLLECSLASGRWRGGIWRRP